MAQGAIARSGTTGAPAQLRRERALRYAAIFFAAGLALHTADHLRRGADSITPEVFWGGMVVTVAGVVAIVAVLTRRPLAPVIAVAVGFPSAVGVSASHLLPQWSAFSDAFPGGQVDALSWAAVLVEIAAAVLLGAAGVASLSRGPSSGSGRRHRPHRTER